MADCFDCIHYNVCVVKPMVRTCDCFKAYPTWCQDCTHCDHKMYDNPAFRSHWWCEYFHKEVEPMGWCYKAERREP